MVVNDDSEFAMNTEWWWLMMINRVYIYTCVWPTGIDEEWIHIYIYTHYWKTVGKPRIKSVPWLGMVYTLYIEIMKTVGWWLWHVVNPTASSSWKKLILNQQKYSDCLGIWMDLMVFSFSDQTRLAGSCPLN